MTGCAGWRGVAVVYCLGPWMHPPGRRAVHRAAPDIMQLAAPLIKGSVAVAWRSVPGSGLHFAAALGSVECSKP